MRVAARKSLVVALCVCALACAGCAPAASAPAVGPSDSGMGGGVSTGAMADGVIAASRNASMTAPVLDIDAGTVNVPRVLAPDDGWIVVRSAEPSGGVLGSAPVRSGENRDVAVKLTSLNSRRLRVGLLVDRGVRGTLEFDPAQPAFALDKPVLVDGSPVDFPLMLTGWGVDADPNSVLLMVEDQPAASVLEVAYLLLPAPSWIEVRRVEKGLATQRLGLLLRAAGEYHRVVIPLENARQNDEVLITVLADSGRSGELEVAANDPLHSVDQPWVSAGVVVSQSIRLR
jgi:hypothetical protein